MLALMLALNVLAPSNVVAISEGAEGESFAVRAAHIRLVGAEVLNDAVLFVDHGKITRVVDAKKAGTIEGNVFRHDGWLSAGLVACRSTCGTRGEGTDWKRAMTPEMRIGDAVDLEHPDFERALECGVTTLVIAPVASNLASGMTAVVKAHGTEPLSREAHASLSFSSRSLRSNREPTSFAGAVADLEAALLKPEGAWKRIASGEVPVLLDASERDEIERALAFATQFKLKGALDHANLAGELAADVKRSGLAAIVGPFGPGSSPRALQSVVALAKEHVPLGFGSGAPWSSHDSLRASAVMCVREGLDAAVAWDALTATGAAIAGVGQRVGKLAPGYDADFVLWSGDPLDLTTHVVAVYVDGHLAFGGKHE